MPITPSNALLEALSPSKIRAAMRPLGAPAMVGKDAANSAPPAARPPEPPPSPDTSRPLRRGSVIDISV